MKKTFLVLLSLSVIGSSYATALEEQTKKLHLEVAVNTNYNITQETHPVLYNMVRELTTQAGTAMPRYISIFNAEYTATSEHGINYTCVRDMNSFVDTMGDLYICREVLKTLSYEEIEGIVALAIAEKSNHVPLKLLATGAGTLAITLSSLYYLNKKYDLKLGSAIKELVRGNHYSYDRYNYHYHDCSHDRADSLKGLVYTLLTPSLITTLLYSHSLQKKIDHDATDITGVQKVIKGIIGLEKVKELYVKEGIMSRIGSALRLKKIWNTIFYPVRAFTPEERVEYLSTMLT